MSGKKVTTLTLKQKKQKGEKITMLTAYDYSAAKIFDEVGIDVLLVGDSLGMVVLGYESTLPVTMEDMLHHVKAVSRGTTNAMVVADMPFMSYHVSVGESVRNAGRFLQEAGANAVKLEGGREVADTVKAIIAAGIPVMGHLGLTPQSINQLGGYRVQGKDEAAARAIINNALALQDAGVFAIVLECVPAPLAKMVTERLDIPTIGIGAGKDCDGQVLVSHDILGLYSDFVPKMAKQYASLKPIIVDAVARYKKEVETGVFPAEEHSFQMAAEELNKLS
ncbi:3-methyl-2-oxobutanoate hydroxymethyltransferase [Thermincola ferriacetica]|uniref:3-methyl-2-oxobutanoate hydroxymethyltransferase n=1 Tax=Thermincola ferriacetica TaxID=281456 RepID=A0A0L6W012_9FIRM|nr:3-methyl-2-oxobutanoate hydroxymethyltransferase [Thermincola ferriacetica]KNZ68870.1 3-methyl-2-oxobutanoate hydroxymethyltransferase [Thermincola ferriacetica]